MIRNTRDGSDRNGHDGSGGSNSEGQDDVQVQAVKLLVKEYLQIDLNDSADDDDSDGEKEAPKKRPPLEDFIYGRVPDNQDKGVATLVPGTILYGELEVPSTNARHHDAPTRQDDGEDVKELCLWIGDTAYCFDSSAVEVVEYLSGVRIPNAAVRWQLRELQREWIESRIAEAKRMQSEASENVSSHHTGVADAYRVVLGAALISEHSRRQVAMIRTEIATSLIMSEETPDDQTLREALDHLERAALFYELAAVTTAPFTNMGSQRMDRAEEACSILSILATIYYKLGNEEEALHATERLVTVGKEIKKRYIPKVRLLLDAARLYIYLGLIDKARPLLEQADRHYREKVSQYEGSQLMPYAEAKELKETLQELQALLQEEESERSEEG